MEARGDIVPYDEPPTDPRGVVKNDVEFAVSSSLSEKRLHNKMQCFRRGKMNRFWPNKKCIERVSMGLP